MSQSKDIIGKKFNRLTVVGLDHKDKKYNKYYKCLCDCGNYTIVVGFQIKSGGVKSCGCLRNEKIPRTHGLSSSPVYKIWLTMKQRCNNPNDKHYKYYGGRGIKVCNEWNDFQSFYDWAISNGYQKGLSIDRIDNDGNYRPENCRWTDQVTQSNNTRTNHYVSYNGETKSLTQWARHFNKKYKQFSYLYRRLKSIDEVLNYYKSKNDGLPYYKEKHIIVTFNGETKALSTFCKELGFNYESILSRIYQRGWSVEKALSEPIANDFDFEYNGNHYTLAALARELNVNPSTLKYQYTKHNKNIEEAIKYFNSKGKKIVHTIKVGKL